MINIRFDLFKPTSGKWGYGGLVPIPKGLQFWNERFIPALISNQTAVIRECFDGEWFLVTDDDPVEFAKPEYTQFYKNLFTPAQLRAGYLRYLALSPACPKCCCGAIQAGFMRAGTLCQGCV